MSEGWVKLHRCLLDKPIWNCSTSEQKSILITILLLANRSEKEWEWQNKKFRCQSGQFVTSSTNLAKAAGCSRQNVRTALARFEKYEFLTYESTKTGILVTLVNWEKYQAKPEELTNQSTNDQPTGNQQVTTNKNNKNHKNDKKNIYTPEFETWYSSWPRPEAKADSAKNFEKKRKEHGLDYILQCSNNYKNYYHSLPLGSLAYQSNNFFGQKAYYLDYELPKEYTAPSPQTQPTIKDETGKHARVV